MSTRVISTVATGVLALVAPTVAFADVTVGPRFGFIDDSREDTQRLDTQNRIVPVLGGVVSLGFNDSPWAVTGSYVRGENSEDPGVERNQVEFDVTATYALNDFFSFAVGYRLSEKDFEFVNPRTGPTVYSGTYTEGHETSVIRAGFNGLVPITEDGSNLAFAAIYGFVGKETIQRQWRRSGTGPDFFPSNVADLESDVYGPELAVGYIFRFNEKISVDARYRASFLYGSEFDSVASSGLTVSLGYRF